MLSWCDIFVYVSDVTFIVENDHVAVADDARVYRMEITDFFSSETIMVCNYIYLAF